MVEEPDETIFMSKSSYSPPSSSSITNLIGRTITITRTPTDAHVTREMKLNHSITIIITQILFVHLYTVLSSTTPPPLSSSSFTATVEEAAATTTTNANDQEDDNYFEVSRENRRIIIEQSKATLLKVLGLKEVPKTTKPHTRVVVPSAMFEEYRNLRDSVRENIPDDSDYYGKLNVHQLEKRHVDFWDVVHNKYPGYDIEVDMDSNLETRIDHLEDRRFLFKGDYERLTYIGPQSEPEDVPKKFELILPPHRQNKPFISVHLRFNLSQELFTSPTSVDELQAAELHLSRERIVNNNYKYDINHDDGDNNNDERVAEARGSYFKTGTSSSSEPTNENERGEELVSTNNGTQPSPQTTTPKNRFLRRARYQRLYLLHVLGYDTHNEPITRIHDSKLIDTDGSAPIMFDIYSIVKNWVLNPADNYGIIVRVTNDDKTDAQKTQCQQLEAATTTTSLDKTTNASNLTATTTTSITEQDVNLSDNGSEEGKSQVVASTNNFAQQQQQQQQIEDHVRLKRGFRSTSEIDQVWHEKQPSIYVFSSPPEFSKRHVKRNTGIVGGGGGSGRPSITSAKTKIQPRKSIRTGDKTVRTGEKCGQKALQINFDEVGWSSWVIAPRNYYANYCHGDCTYPMSDYQNATNHAIIQSIFHSAGRVVPKSCCAPTKLGSMAILYQLDGVVQMRFYADMIVESCGCV